MQDGGSRLLTWLVLRRRAEIEEGKDQPLPRSEVRLEESWPDMAVRSVAIHPRKAHSLFPRIPLVRPTVVVAPVAGDRLQFLEIAEGQHPEEEDDPEISSRVDGQERVLGVRGQLVQDQEAGHGQ